MSLRKRGDGSRCFNGSWWRIVVRSRCESFEPARSWASRWSRSTPRPTATPLTWSSPIAAICIGKAPSTDSYLNIPRLIAAAEVADVQAIHPGYGFLSENPQFAEICRSCNFEFIGPPHEAIRKMGLKTEAKQIAAAAKVACVPGSDGAVESDAEALNLARSIGFPVLIKAAAGGGGKGMRVCRDEANLTSALQMARNEAEAAFKNPSIYLEKFIDRPRHVEVQILADSHGNVVHCWDRDCSLQRRHQKLVEEAPAPTAAARGPRRAWPGRRPPGQDRGLRQRRHLRVPGRCREPVLLHRGQRADPGRAPRHRDGHRHRPGPAADPDRRRRALALPPGGDRHPRPFHRMPDQLGGSGERLSPSPGQITAIRVPGGPGVRWDSHVQAGYTVPPNYDSLLGKLIVHAPTRLEALARMRRALDELVIEGVQTTIPLHRTIFRNKDFIEGQVDTTWVERVLIPQARSLTAARDEKVPAR